MMQSATSLTSSGLRDWMVQRVTAVVLGLYFIFLIGYFACHPHLAYSDWQALFANPLMRIFTFLALLSVVGHAWVGMWTVFTDYIHNTAVSIIVQALMILALLSYLAWGVAILWRI